MVSTSGPLGAQQPFDSLRLAAVTGAVCYTFPDPDAPIANRYHLGETIGASKSTRGTGGRLYYFDSWRVRGISPTCWVPAYATIPFDRRHPEGAYAAIAERLLARGDSASFEQLVEAENFLIEPLPNSASGPSPLAESGLVQIRRLMLVDRAASRLDARHVDDEPLERAWILAHHDLLFYFEPDAAWYLRGDAYWAIIDANIGAPWADAVAWYVAQRPSPSDECDADCYLDMIRGGPQQYWIRFPSGTSVHKALDLAIRLAGNAVDGLADGNPTRAAIDRVRASLGRVNAPEKARLLGVLSRLDNFVKP